jgi:hypothetical protein
MEQRSSRRSLRPAPDSATEPRVVYVEPSGLRRFWKDGKPPRFRVRGAHVRKGGMFFASPGAAVAFYASYGITVVEAGEA